MHTPYACACVLKTTYNARSDSSSGSDCDLPSSLEEARIYVYIYVRSHIKYIQTPCVCTCVRIYIYRARRQPSTPMVRPCVKAKALGYMFVYKLYCLFNIYMHHACVHVCVYTYACTCICLCRGNPMYTLYNGNHIDSGPSRLKALECVFIYVFFLISVSSIYIHHTWCACVLLEIY